MKIVFFGTPEFSIPALAALVDDARFEIVGVVTQPDRPSGRKQELLPSPVKAWALEHKLTVLQPVSLKDEEIVATLKAIQADVFVVVAYGKLIPDAIIEIPPHDTVNIHPSLLPKYRGPSPLQAAILNGDTETGVTLMLVRKEMDAGDILVQEHLALTPEETLTQLSERAAHLGADILIRHLPEWVEGRIKPITQDAAHVTTCTLVTREDGEVHWSESAEQILRKARAYEPWPGLYTVWEGSRLKLQELSPAGRVSTLAPGLVHVDEGHVFIGTGTQPVEVLCLQMEGRSSMDTTAFLRGMPAFMNARLPS